MPAMQTRYHEDNYPLGRFILDRTNTLGLTRRELVERLGFRDRLAKGHQVLSEILLTGTVPSYCTKFAEALEVDQSFLDQVLLTTARQQEAERQEQLLAEDKIHRARFVPHLQIQTERRVPSPIFIAALVTVERLRIVYLPDEINSVEEDERDRIVREIIQKHYRDTSGQVATFGKITGYYFVRLAGFGGVDFGVLYGRCGSPIGSMVSVRRLPGAALGTKRGNTRLSGSLKAAPISVIDLS